MRSDPPSGPTNLAHVSDSDGQPVSQTRTRNHYADHHCQPGKRTEGAAGGNARNGTRSKTVLTEAGPVEVDVPRDRAGSFEPVVVRKRQRRLGSIEDIVLALSARGMTHGGVAEWQNHPSDPEYPVVSIDCINVRGRDDQVANQPTYMALPGAVDGNRAALGLWVGDGGGVPSTGCRC